MRMSARVRVLKELVDDGLYVVDHAAVADAVLLRAQTRHMLPDVAFRGTPRPEPEVRSFRPHRGAKSFRLTRAERRRVHRSGVAVPVTA
jgi:putative hemolysin